MVNAKEITNYKELSKVSHSLVRSLPFEVSTIDIFTKLVSMKQVTSSTFSWAVMCEDGLSCVKNEG